MTRITQGIVATLAAAATIGCASASTTTAGARSTFAFTPCQSAPNASPRDTATVNVMLTTEPAASDSAEAAIRIEGETDRSTMNVNASAPLTMRLLRGVYDLRISLAGYRAVSGQMALTAGCSTNLTITLRRG